MINDASVAPSAAGALKTEKWLNPKAVAILPSARANAFPVRAEARAVESNDCLSAVVIKYIATQARCLLAITDNGIVFESQNKIV